MRFRDIGEFIRDRIPFTRRPGEGGNAGKPVQYDLPDDVYQPSMTTSDEHMKRGARKLRDGWRMIVSARKPAVSDPGWRDVKMPAQWAVTDPALFSNSGNVWYMKKFTVRPDETGPDKHLQLTFKGVDYKSQVYVNDEKLAEHEGYFSPFSVSLDGKARADRENVLMVNVSAPKDTGAPLFKNQVKGIFMQHDCRPAGSNAFKPTSYAGSTGGIWNDVILESSGRQTIENQHVETKLSDDHRKADLTFHSLLCNHGDAPKEVEIVVCYGPRGEKDPAKKKMLHRTIELKPGFNNVSIQAQEQDPKLWWTCDKGEPSLYDMETSILDGGVLSDSKKGHFGIREIDFDPKTGRLKLNDELMFQRGTNYIPTQWLSTYDKGKYERDVDQMKAANLNAVRVHASILPQEFYDVADEKGLLVWADFPLIWGTSTTPRFVAEARKQFKEFIELYRNHPSIFMWCAHNEPLPHDMILDGLLARDAARLDPTRPRQGASHFGEHLYPGWYTFPYGKDMTDVTKYKPKTASEFGSQSIPASMKKIISADKQWPISKHEEAWKFHDFQPAENYRAIGRPEAFKNLDDYLETTQKYQYDYIRFVTEYFRRAHFAPTASAYQFMFKDCWPQVSWAVVDFRNQTRMGFEALKEAMSPALVSIEWKRRSFKPGETVEAPVWLVNDGKGLKGTRVAWKIYDFEDKEKKAQSSGALDADVPGNSSKAVLTVRHGIPKDAPPGKRWVLDVSWTDQAGKPLSHNAYMFRTESPRTGEYRYEPRYPRYPPVG
jgi:beta-mannosidase